MSQKLKTAFNNYWNNSTPFNAKRLVNAYEREQSKGILLTRDECDTIADARFNASISQR